MIRTARLRASGFQARAISQKNDQPRQRLRRKVDAHYFTPHPDSVVDRSFARVAIQHRLGLLSGSACVGRLMRTILLLILILLLIGALPTWPYSTGWGYYPSGGLGLILLILIILALMGRL